MNINLKILNIMLLLKFIKNINKNIWAYSIFFVYSCNLGRDLQKMESDPNENKEKINQLLEKNEITDEYYNEKRRSCRLDLDESYANDHTDRGSFSKSITSNFCDRYKNFFGLQSSANSLVSHSPRRYGKFLP